MKSKGLIFFIILSIIPGIGLAQSVSKFGMEFGMSFSQFPTKNVISSPYDLETTRINPIISPLVGISDEWMIFKHIQFVSGLQYHMNGTRSYMLLQYNNDASFGYSEIWENLKTQQICLSLMSASPK